MTKKNIIMIGLLSIILFYIPVLFLTEDSLLIVTKEDGIYESFGALFFFFASIVFLYTFLKTRKRNFIFALFALAFFFAAGEEIAWGQRILNFATPPAIEAVNAQGDFTIHNLNFLQHETLDGGITSLIKAALNFNHLFILFWVVYCILVPLANKYSRKLESLFSRIHLPIISVWFGVLFLINEVICQVLTLLIISHLPTRPPIAEIKESLWALFVFLFGLSLLPLKKALETRKVSLITQYIKLKNM